VDKAFSPCGRFAPSPTGPLHFGSLIAAVASYANVAHRQGRWLVRIEDLDTQRVSLEAAADILATLDAYGFPLGDCILRQSERTPHYVAALAQLSARGYVFACRCSRRTLAESGVMGIEGPIYGGTCRDAALPLQSTDYAMRFRVRDPFIKWLDAIQGAQSQDLANDVGDFVVQRRGGEFAYQLAVVVDDAESGVTEVVRGADLLDSTARQIAIQNALGIRRPQYAHVPLALNPDHAKLSKQTLAPAIGMAEAVAQLRRAWRHLGQVPLAQSIPSASEFWRLAIPRWQLAAVPRVRGMVV
jgi:glutamyl-Q tRNA(Asp) synthetase